MAKTKDHPLGEPTPSSTIGMMIEDAGSMARRICSLRDRLLGASPVDEASGRTGFFTDRSGVLNELASGADRVGEQMCQARTAIEQIEEAMGVHNIAGSNAQSARQSVTAGERALPRYD